MSWTRVNTQGNMMAGLGWVDSKVGSGLRVLVLIKGWDRGVARGKHSGGPVARCFLRPNWPLGLVGHQSSAKWRQAMGSGSQSSAKEVWSSSGRGGSTNKYLG
jgi:hypothetical protein